MNKKNGLYFWMILMIITFSNCSDAYNGIPSYEIKTGTGKGAEYPYQFNYVVKPNNSPWILVYFHGMGGDASTLFSYRKRFFEELMDDPRGPALAIGFSYGVDWWATGRKIENSKNINIPYQQVWTDIHSMLNEFDEVDSYPLTIMGLSMGGHNALQLGVHYPESINRLVLQSPTCLPVSSYKSSEEIDLYCAEVEKKYGTLKTRISNFLGRKEGTITYRVNAYLARISEGSMSGEVWGVEKDFTSLINQLTVCPKTYISCASKDPFTLMEGSLLLRDSLVSRGGTVDFHSVPSKEHLAYDWQSVLEFLLESETQNAQKDQRKDIDSHVSNYSEYQKDYVLVKAGSFTIGSPITETNRDKDEIQTHVTLTHDFYIGKYEVTQKLWKEVMVNNPSFNKGDCLPVETVSREEAILFCNKLSQRDGFSPAYSGTGDRTLCNFKANGYRLPTEAEWEYAARGGQYIGDYQTYAGSNNIDSVAWYDANSSKNIHLVGQKEPNLLGLYDMSGNVWEMCWDWKGDYHPGSITDPTGPMTGSLHIVRGGSWSDYGMYCRSALRGHYSTGRRYQDHGFRLVRTSFD